MTFLDILLSADFVLAAAVYALSAAPAVALFRYIHDQLEGLWLEWPWERIFMPLLRAALMLVFMGMAYPAIFGLPDAPPLGDLLSRDDMRIHHLLNLVFVITLFFPMVPVVGKWEELVLPLQGIAASLLLFTWLARDLNVWDVHYWPGFDTAWYMLGMATLTHFAAIYLAGHLGTLLDRRFHLEQSGEMIERFLVIWLQGPVIVLFCRGLGRQLTP